MMRLVSRQCAFLVGLFSLAILAGCAKAPGNITGQVSVGGKPVTAGTITFYDSKNNPASSPIADGKYKVSKVAAGPAKVTVVSPMDVPIASPLGGGATSLKPAGGGKGPTVPPKYATQDQTPLQYEVKSGDQTHDIDLTP